MERDIRISLKLVRYRRRKDGPVIPPLQMLLSTMFEKVKAVSDTVVASTSTDETSSLARQYFLNNWNLEACGAWSFQVCSYLPGLQPKYLKELDLSEKSVKLTNATVKNEKGETLELATVYHALAFGDVVIVERRRGAGGTHALSMVLMDLVRRHVDDKFPSMVLEDVVSRNLRREIEIYGGAVGIKMRLQEPAAPGEAVFNEQMSAIRGTFNGSKDLTVEWRAKSVFTTEEVADAYEAADESEEVSSFEITTRDGPSIQLNKYRLHKVIQDFPVDQSSTPELEAIVSEMVDYLGELMLDDGEVSYLTPEGKLSNLIARKGAPK